LPGRARRGKFCFIGHFGGTDKIQLNSTASTPGAAITNEARNKVILLAPYGQLACAAALLERDHLICGYGSG
jgi:hypothetical protein